MSHTEKMLDSASIFEGKIIHVRKDTVRLENGHETFREMVVHHGGVCIAAVDKDDNILLVKQFRYPYGKEIIELPAGKLEKGENPMECGIRELKEECGCVADSFEKLGELYPTPAYCTEVIHIYKASGLHQEEQQLDDGEFLTVLRVPFDKALEMVMNGEIVDAKTQIGILKLYQQRNSMNKM